MNTKTLIILAIQILMSGTALPQSHPSAPDSGVLHQHFDSLYRIDPALINGDFYQDPTPPSTQGDPFFGDPSWHTGSVVLDGIKYENQNLRYDICNNQIVCYIQDPEGSALQLSLAKNRISRFSLDSLSFIRYPGPEANYSGRFCRIIDEGEVTLLEFRSKRLKVLTSSTTTYSYETFARFFLVAGGRTIPYTGPATVYRLFPDRKQDLRTFCRSRNLHFGKSRIESHRQFIAYLNQLLESSQ